jgi:hypothetical protein
MTLPSQYSVEKTGVSGIATERAEVEKIEDVA